jgi:transaldolase
MRLYLDTADRATAEPLLATGLFAGLTTNPTILQRASLSVSDIPDIHRWAVSAGAREVFFQAWGQDTATLTQRGQQLRGLGKEVVVKLVASRAGSAACAELAARDVPTLLTAVYAPSQAIVAAAAGATYLAPYLGKLQDAGRDGMADIIAMHEILTAAGSQTRVLLASIRDATAIVSLARHGIQHFTIAPTVADQLFANELTADAVRIFEEAVLATSS